MAYENGRLLKWQAPQTGDTNNGSPVLRPTARTSSLPSPTPCPCKRSVSQQTQVPREVQARLFRNLIALIMAGYAVIFVGEEIVRAIGLA